MIPESTFENLRDGNNLKNYLGKSNPKTFLNDKVHINSEANKQNIQGSIFKKNIKLYDTVKIYCLALKSTLLSSKRVTQNLSLPLFKH